MSSQHNLNYNRKYNVKFSSGVPPLVKKLPEREKKNQSFFNEVIIGYVSHTPGQAPWSGVIGQYKSDSMLCFVLFFFKGRIRT